MGLYQPLLPPRPDIYAIVADAMSEVNRTPGTGRDDLMAAALMRELGRRGLRVVAASGEGD